MSCVYQKVDLIVFAAILIKSAVSLYDPDTV